MSDDTKLQQYLLRALELFQVEVEKLGDSELDYELALRALSNTDWSLFQNSFLFLSQFLKQTEFHLNRTLEYKGVEALDSNASSKEDSELTLNDLEIVTLLKEVIDVHLYNSKDSELNYVIWCSPTAFTQVHRVTNIQMDFPMGQGDWIYEYRLIWYGKKLMEYREPFLIGGGSEVSLKGFFRNIPRACMDELLLMRSRVRVDWYDELNHFSNSHPGPGSNTEGTAKYVDHSQDEALHVFPAEDDGFLLLGKSFSLKVPLVEIEEIFACENKLLQPDGMYIIEIPRVGISLKVTDTNWSDMIDEFQAYKAARNRAVQAE